MCIIVLHQDAVAARRRRRHFLFVTPHARRNVTAAGGLCRSRLGGTVDPLLWKHSLWKHPLLWKRRSASRSLWHFPSALSSLTWAILGTKFFLLSRSRICTKIRHLQFLHSICTFCASHLYISVRKRAPFSRPEKGKTLKALPLLTEQRSALSPACAKRW